MYPEIGVPKAAKMCLSTPIGRSWPPNEHAREASGYFPNSFYSITYAQRPDNHCSARISGSENVRKCPKSWAKRTLDQGR
jgi:hypothetical protein